jgi:tRNA/tmRNA/rRNA uracil-C5-methylase (TrmA/RlmC/RlmD family)
VCVTEKKDQENFKQEQMSATKIASQLSAIVTESSSLLSKKKEAKETLLTKMIDSNTNKLSSGDVTFTIVEEKKKKKLPYNEKNITAWLQDFENGKSILEYLKTKSQQIPEEEEEDTDSPPKKLKITKRKRG